MALRILSFVFCVLLLSGCATESQLESNLTLITQKGDKNVVFKAIGEPSSTLKIGGFTIYSWLVIDGKISSENRVGSKSVTCVIRIIESDLGYLSWEYDGNASDCKPIVDKIKSYLARQGPLEQLPEHVTEDEKRSWVKTIAELNGCAEVTEIKLSRAEGTQEHYDISCSNKEMQIQCEFSGPVFTDYKGIPFVKVSGKNYSSQPACWLE